MNNLNVRAVGLAAVVLLGVACSGDPTVAAGAFIAKGDQYVRDGRLRAAVLEYRNAIDRQPANASAHLKLADVYDQLGESANALNAYVQVTKLDQSNVTANLRVASALLASQRLDDAERLLETSLTAQPRHAPTLVAMAATLDALGRKTEARKRLDEALASDPMFAGAYLLEGRWAVRDKRSKEAEAAFRKAVVLDARSADAWAALGTYLWSVRQLPEAEQALTQAINTSSDKSPARRLLASFYISEGRAAEAEPHLRQVAESGPGGKLALADYYLSLGKVDAAQPLLSALLKDSRFAGEAHLRRARLFYAAGRQADANVEIETAVKDAGVADAARLVRSDWRLERGNPQGALEDARQVVAQRPRSAAAHYAVGAAALALNDLTEAERAFKAVGDLAPQTSAFKVQLARIQLARGDVPGAERLAAQAASSLPGPAAYSVWARTLYTGGNRTRAQQVLDEGERRWPNTAELATERGYLALASQQPDQARVAFERALALLPDEPAAREGLVTAHLAAKSPQAARAALEKWRSAAPRNAALALLAAKVELVDRNVPAAQSLLERFADQSPDPAVSEALGEIYLGTGRTADALATLERAAAQRPRPVAALIAIGMLKEERGDVKGARAAYEQVLALEPKAGVAANNLAWIAAGEGRVDDAIALALKAQAALADAPQALDTLGWMYHLAGRHDQAIRWLQAARKQAPDSPLYRYHLGAAYAGAGRAGDARRELEQALRAPEPFDGAAQARALLASLGPES